MMGNMIGVGIFIYPVLIASKLPHPIWFLIVWILGGLIALTGALSSAELGIFFPEAGGDYAYLRNMYGKRWAFLYGFLTFFITFPGSIAIGVGLTLHYQGASILGNWVNNIFFSSPILEVKYYQLLACIIIILLTIVNHFGIHSAFFVQKLVTLGPVVFLIFISLVAIFFIQWDLVWNGLASSILSQNMSIPFEFPGPLELATALVPVYWTFSGWNSPLALGAEIQNPEKVIPKTMILGPVIVTFIYLLFSFVFICLIPYLDFKEGKIDPYIAIGQYMLTRIGIEEKNILEFLPKLMSLIIFLIVIGNTNSCIISGSRIYVAMARDELFWEKVGYIDPVKKSPTVSIWLQSLWAILLLLFISKESNLLNFSFIAITFLSVMTIFSVFLIRLKKIQIAKLYKTYGYPFTPIVYISSSLFILLLIIISYINEKKFSIIFSAVFSILLGLIGYEIWKKYSHFKTKEKTFF
jgi:APA family basic amino acid/polyamine antiporter